MRVISRIALKLGKPLCLDNITHERKRISYARVLVEVDTSTVLIESFDVRLPFGTMYTQYVSYENLPKFCKHCFMFGLYMDKCKFFMKEDDTGKQNHGMFAEESFKKMTSDTTGEGSKLGSNDFICPKSGGKPCEDLRSNPVLDKPEGDDLDVVEV